MMACIYIYIDIYQMDCVCQRYHKECSTRTCADDCKNWLNSQTKYASLTSWRQPFCKMKSMTPKQQHFYVTHFKNENQITTLCYTCKINTITEACSPQINSKIYIVTNIYASVGLNEWNGPAPLWLFVAMAVGMAHLFIYIILRWRVYVIIKYIAN